MIHYPDVDNAIHSHLGVGDDRGARTAIHLPLWSDVGGANGGTGAGLAAAVSGRTKIYYQMKYIRVLIKSIVLLFITSIFFPANLNVMKAMEITWVC